MIKDLEKMDDLDLYVYPMAMTFISVAFIVVALPLAFPGLEFKMNLFQIIAPPLSLSEVNLVNLY